MFVRHLGEGPVSLVLHGFAGDGAEMLELADLLPGRKLVPDLPGHGSSSPPPDPAHLAMETVVDDLVGVLDEERLDECDLVGYSLGGRVALAMAAMAPERVRSVVAIGARTGIADTQLRDQRRASDEALADEIEARGIDWFVEEWVGLPLYDTQRALGDEHMARVVEARRCNEPSSLAAVLRRLGPGVQPVVTDDLVDGGRPVGLLVGELDHRFRVVAADIAAAVPHASVIVVPGVGHATHVEAPQATADAIVRFWADVR